MNNMNNPNVNNLNSIGNGASLSPQHQHQHQNTSSPYRNNYHIQPTESKIVYTSPTGQQNKSASPPMGYNYQQLQSQQPMASNNYHGVQSNIPFSGNGHQQQQGRPFSSSPGRTDGQWQNQQRDGNNVVVGVQQQQHRYHNSSTVGPHGYVGENERTPPMVANMQNIPHQGQHQPYSGYRGLTSPPQSHSLNGHSHSHSHSQSIHSQVTFNYSSQMGSQGAYRRESQQPTTQQMIPSVMGSGGTVDIRQNQNMVQNQSQPQYQPIQQHLVNQVPSQQLHQLSSPTSFISPPQEQIYNNSSYQQNQEQYLNQNQIQQQHEILPSSQHQPQRDSSEQYQRSSSDAQHQQQTLLANQNTSTSTIWQHRFIQIYQKFQWFYQRYKFITTEFTTLSNDFENVNSEDEWLQLKEKHDLLLEKIQQIQQELFNTMHQNQQLAEQYELEHRNSSNKESNNNNDEGERIWEHRYHELLEEYKDVQEKYSNLEAEANRIGNGVGLDVNSGVGVGMVNNNGFGNPSNSSGINNANNNNGGGTVNSSQLTPEQTAQLQSKFVELQNEYNILCDEYQKIRIQYEKTYDENNELATNLQQSSQVANKMQTFIDELQHENDQLKEELEKRVANGNGQQQQSEDMVSIEEVKQMQEDYNNEIKKYCDEVQRAHAHIEQFDEQMGIKHEELEQLSQLLLERENRIKELEESGSGRDAVGVGVGVGAGRDVEEELNRMKLNEKELLNELDRKEYERKGFEDRLRLVERDLEEKKVELEQMSSNFNDKLSKIEQNTSNNQFNSVHSQQSSSTHNINSRDREDLQSQIHNESRKYSQQYEGQIMELQHSLREAEQKCAQKTNEFRQLQQMFDEMKAQLQNEIRNAIKERDINFVESEKRVNQMEIDYEKRIAEKDVRISILESEKERLQMAVEEKIRERQESITEVQRSVQVNEKVSQERHQSVVMRLEEKIMQKDQTISSMKNYLLKYEREISAKNQEIIELKELSNKSRSISQSGKTQLSLVRQELRIKEETLERKNDEITKLKREKEYKMKQMNELQGEIADLQEQSSKKMQIVSGLKRQLNEYFSIQSELQNVRSNLVKKTAEVSELRNQQFEVERLRLENETMRRESDRYLSQSKQRLKEVERLKESNYELEKKVLSLSSLGGSHGQRHNESFANSRYKWDDSEVTELKDLIRKKDNQIARLNQAIQESKSGFQNKSRDYESLRAQMNATTRNKETEVNSLNHRVESSQKRVQDLEMKKAQLQEENREMRISFEEQLKAESQRHKVYYTNIIARHQEDYKELSLKLTDQIEQTNQLEITVEKQKSAQKYSEVSMKELQRKLLNAQSLLSEKEQIFENYRQKQSQTEQSHKSLYEKISALDLQLKTKDQQIKLSQEKNSYLEQKIKKNKRQYENFRNKLMVSQEYQNNNSVIEYLSKRIADYESNMVQQNQSQHDFGFQVKDNEANHVFENQVIYHLKKENDLLRKELSGKGMQYERQILNQIEEENMKRSKNLKNSLISSKVLLGGNGGATSSQYLNLGSQNVDDINFYKEKNKELDERVEKHIKVNKQLKEKIEQLIKGNTDTNESQALKEQIKEFQLTIVNLNKQIQVLTEQNRSVRRGLSQSQIKVEANYEGQVKQLQGRLSVANKTIQQTTAECSNIKIAYSEIQMQKSLLTEELKRVNDQMVNMSSSKHKRQDEEVSQMRERCESYQNEITRLSNKCRILESEIQRLNETQATMQIFFYMTKQMYRKLTSNELQNLKGQFNEINQKFLNCEANLHEEQIRSKTLTDDVVKWQQKSKFLENELERLNELNELYTKKQRASNVSDSSASMKQSISSFQLEINSLRAQITTIGAEKAKLEAKVTQLVEQIKQNQGLLQSLEYYIEFLRSGVIEGNTLIEEMVLISGGRNDGAVMGEGTFMEVLKALRLNVENSLDCLDKVFRKVKARRY